MKKNKPIYYMVCSTSRSGSTLLCNLMENTNILGKRNYERIHKKFIGQIDWKKEDLKEFLIKNFKDTLTSNNVGGFKVLWHQIEFICDDVSKIRKYKKALIKNMTVFFPKDLKYIWLVRKEKVKQTISYLNARQDGVWAFNKKERKEQFKNYNFDLDKMEFLNYELKRQEKNWKKFFEKNKIKPLKLMYEDYTKDLKEALIKILN